MNGARADDASIRRILRILAVFGICFGLATLRDEISTIAPGVLLKALLLAIGSLLAAGRQWSGLFHRHPVQLRRLRHSFYTSQVLKYLPLGGMAQATAQVVGDADDGSTTVERTPRLLFSVASIVSVTAFLGVAVLFYDEPKPMAKGLALALAPMVLIVHPVASRMFNLVAQRFRLTRTMELPALSKGIRVRTYLWSLANVALTAASFVVVLQSVADAPDNGLLVAAFSLAWLAGFLVFPLPGGLGVRESVLIAALPATEPRQILAAALVHRAVTLLAEVSVLGGSTIVVRLPLRVNQTRPN